MIQVSAKIIKLIANDVFQTTVEQLNESVPAQTNPVPIKEKSNPPNDPRFTSFRNWSPVCEWNDLNLSAIVYLIIGRIGVNE
jgi:hypothetical protein